MTWFLRHLIAAYRAVGLPIKGRCRYWPGCSAYMDEALARHGAWTGLGLGLRRLLRCGPWGSAGFDPVPEQLERKL
jgi:putative membrane protein insertion efficiency factor